MQEAEDAGVLFIKSAGNHGKNIDTDSDFHGEKFFDFLSRYSNVLIVGGTARDGGLSPRMNFGKRVGIAAPCVDMVCPSWDGYEQLKGPGTSFSAPIVAAAAATLLSQEPDLTPAAGHRALEEVLRHRPGHGEDRRGTPGHGQAVPVMLDPAADRGRTQVRQFVGFLVYLVDVGRSTASAFPLTAWRGSSRPRKHEQGHPRFAPPHWTGRARTEEPGVRAERNPVSEHNFGYRTAVMMHRHRISPLRKRRT